MHLCWQHLKVNNQINTPPCGHPSYQEGNQKPTSKHPNSPSSLKGWQPKADGVDVFNINEHIIPKHYTPNLPRNPKLKDKAKALRKAGVLSEVLFWQQVHRKKFYGIDFDRQYIIGNYIVDFYSKALRLVIEIDGQIHDAKGAYDETRQSFLKNLGLTICRIQDKDIKQNIERVMQQLEDFIVQNYTNTPPFGHPSCQAGNERPTEKHLNSPSKLKGWTRSGWGS